MTEEPVDTFKQHSEHVIDLWPTHLRDEWFNQIPLLAFQYSVHPTTPGVVLD
jgi:hypothetical protein